jgi:uncharacterized protein YjbJ (UPF0337 family)
VNSSGMAGNVGRGPSGVCIIVITNFRRVAVAPIYNPTAFKILAIMVDKDRIQGSAEQARGKVKEVVGKVTGDSKLEGEGKADQFKGKVQNAVGGLRHSAGQVIPHPEGET